MVEPVCELVEGGLAVEALVGLGERVGGTVPVSGHRQGRGTDSNPDTFAAPCDTLTRRSHLESPANLIWMSLCCRKELSWMQSWRKHASGPHQGDGEATVLTTESPSDPFT